MARGAGSIRVIGISLGRRSVPWVRPCTYANVYRSFNFFFFFLSLEGVLCFVYFFCLFIISLREGCVFCKGLLLFNFYFVYIFILSGGLSEVARPPLSLPHVPPLPR